MIKLKRVRSIKNPPKLQPVSDGFGKLDLPKYRDGGDVEKMRDRTLDLRNPDVQVILRKMGSLGGPNDVKKARRVLGIMRQIPEYSDLEALTAEYLKRKGIAYRDQVALYGGRNAVAGSGIVVDFLVRGNVGWIAWACHGLHWHSRIFSGDANYSARLKALSTSYLSFPVVAYVELWEDDCWIHGDRVFDTGAAGLEFSPGRRV